MEKIKIWGENIPFNSSKSKMDILDVHKEYTMEDIFQNHPGVFDLSCDFTEDMSGNDTMVYREEIISGKAKDTFEDEPYLIPYILEGSKKCVISCPGGAYLMKDMANEGEDVAAFLNAAGISCFVLWYRSYPYKSPVMFRDCQRAIRYIRFHSADYGIDPEDINIIGFSAGGNLAGTTVEIFRNTPIEAEGYVPDEVDQTSAHVKTLGLIYPAVTFENSKALLQCVEDRELLRDEKERNRLAEYYTIKNHVQEKDAPAFICSALDDKLIPALEVFELGKVYKEKNVPFELHIFDRGGHGFGGCNPERANPMFPPDYTRVVHWKELYATWLKSL